MLRKVGEVHTSAMGIQNKEIPLEAGREEVSQRRGEASGVGPERGSRFRPMLWKGEVFL